VEHPCMRLLPRHATQRFGRRARYLATQRLRRMPDIA